MRVRDAFVIAAEEGEEVLRQVVFIEIVERADDAEIECNVTTEGIGGDRHLNIPWMHVGVEKAVAENLCEENLDAIARQFFQVDAGSNQSVGLRNRDAVHALHHDDRRRAIVPVHFRHDQQI